MAKRPPEQSSFGITPDGKNFRVFQSDVELTLKVKPAKTPSAEKYSKFEKVAGSTIEVDQDRLPSPFDQAEKSDLERLAEALKKGRKDKHTK
jgi:hypothetical protein